MNQDLPAEPVVPQVLGGEWRGLTSLTRRLIGIAALWVGVLLLGGGFALDRVLTGSLTENFDEQLEYILNKALIASSEIGPDGEVRFSRPPADQRFLEPYSGIYFQVSGTGTDTFPSRSLWDRRLRVNTAHNDIELHRYDSSEFDGEPLRIVERDAVLPGHVALDVGANVGAYALLLGQWVGPTGRVFAFEPAPDVHAALARHISLNRLDDIVRPVAAALSDRETEAPLVLSGTAGESRLAVPGDSGDVRSVSLTTIDRFCAREGLAPDFIKIDVEGWELSVLRGARDTIRSRGAALALFVELHPSIWPTLGLSRRDVEAELGAQDLKLAPLTPGEDPWAVEGVAVRLRPRGCA